MLGGMCMGAIRGWGLGDWNGAWGHGWVVGWNPTLRLLSVLIVLLSGPFGARSEVKREYCDAVLSPTQARAFLDDLISSAFRGASCSISSPNPEGNSDCSRAFTRWAKVFTVYLNGLTGSEDPLFMAKIQDELSYALSGVVEATGLTFLPSTESIDIPRQVEILLVNKADYYDHPVAYEQRYIESASPDYDVGKIQWFRDFVKSTEACSSFQLATARNEIFNSTIVVDSQAVWSSVESCLGYSFYASFGGAPSVSANASASPNYMAAANNAPSSENLLKLRLALIYGYPGAGQSYNPDALVSIDSFKEFARSEIARVCGVSIEP
jgi:hypothetical protein